MRSTRNPNLDGFGFEVVAEGEVAEHLEESLVAAGVADTFSKIVVFTPSARTHFCDDAARV